MLLFVVLNMFLSILLWRQDNKELSAESYLRVNGSAEEPEREESVSVQSSSKVAVCYSVVMLVLMVLTHLQLSTFLKQVQPHITYLKHLDILNYLLFALLFFFLIRVTYRKFFLTSARKGNMSIVAGSYYALLIVKMAIYDYHNPRYFSQ